MVASVFEQLILRGSSAPDLSTLKQRVTSVEKTVTDAQTGLESKAAKAELGAKVDQVTFDQDIQRLDTDLKGKVDKEGLGLEFLEHIDRYIKQSEEGLKKAVGDDFAKKFTDAFEVLVSKCVDELKIAQEGHMKRE